MNGLEDRLRDSLRARAKDVSASPELWERVQGAVVRRRRTTMLAVASSTAFAVAVGAFAVPRLLGQDERPEVVVDSAPVPAPTSPAVDGAPVDGAYPVPEFGLAFARRTLEPGLAGVLNSDGAVDELVAVRLADGAVTGSLVLDAAPVAIAVRPHREGEVLEVAYVAASGDQWQVRVRSLFDVRSSADLGQLDDGAFSDALVAEAPLVVGGVEVLPPGLAWSPDGDLLSALETTAGPGVPATSFVSWHIPRSVEQTSDTGPGRLGTEVGRTLLADGATVGRLTLKTWTWDDTYEDGMVGRAYLLGDGRGWRVSVTRDGDGSVSTGPLDPVDVAADFAVGGPDIGPVALHAQADGGFEVEWLDFSSGGATEAPASSGFHDVAAGPIHALVSTNGQLFVWGGEDLRDVPAEGREWGAVDLVVAPWTAVFVPADGGPVTPPGPEPEQVVLPEFIVVSTGQTIELQRSNGQTIQVLWRVEGSEDGILSLDVRPGSTTEDLTVAFLLWSDTEVAMMSLRGRADDQAGLAVDATRWPDRYQPGHPENFWLGQERLGPVFSGDGDFVAYVDNGPDGSSLTFHGWLPDADVPGTGRPADDNASFGRGDPAMSLDFFSDLGTSRGGGDGYYVVMTASDGTTSTCEYERQADGALAEVICEADWGADLDVVDATDRVLLVARGGEMVLLDPSRRVDGDDEVQWALPDELRTADREMVWMTGRGPYVFVGSNAGQAWLVTPEGHQEFSGYRSWVAALR